MVFKRTVTEAGKDVTEATVTVMMMVIVVIIITLIITGLPQQCGDCT